MSQQPTFQITKEHFVGVINSLHAQFVKDKENTSLLGQIYNAEIPGYYDNSNLVNAVFSFLHEVFPKDEDGFCPIEHYCYTLSFGKCGEEYESPEELFDRLNAHKLDVEMELDLWESRKDIREYPIAPEDAFTYPLDGEMVAFNAGIMKQVHETAKMMYDGAKNAMDKKISWKNQDKTDAGKPNPYLIDEAGQFQTKDNLEANKKYWQHVVSKHAKQSPDETA